MQAWQAVLSKGTKIPCISGIRNLGLTTKFASIFTKCPDGETNLTPPPLVPRLLLRQMPTGCAWWLYDASTALLKQAGWHSAALAGPVVCAC